MDQIKILHTSCTGHVFKQTDQLVRTASKFAIKPLLNTLKAVILGGNNSCTQCTVLNVGVLIFSRY